MKETLLQHAISMLDVDYIWGGMTRSGVDCWGLIELWADEHYPKLFPGDHYAASAWDILPPTQSVQPGDLCFWADKGRVYHVAVVERIENGMVHTIGAHGGNSKTTTHAIAVKMDARVKRLAVPLKKLYGFRTWPNKPLALTNAAKVLSVPPHSNEPPEWHV